MGDADIGAALSFGESGPDVMMEKDANEMTQMPVNHNNATWLTAECGAVGQLLPYGPQSSSASRVNRTSNRTRRQVSWLVGCVHPAKPKGLCVKIGDRSFAYQTIS